MGSRRAKPASARIGERRQRRVTRGLLVAAFACWGGCVVSLVGAWWYGMRLWRHYIVGGESDWTWSSLYLWSRIVRRDAEHDPAWESRRRHARQSVLAFGVFAAGFVVFLFLASLT